MLRLGRRCADVLTISDRGKVASSGERGGAALRAPERAESVFGSAPARPEVWRSALAFAAARDRAADELAEARAASELASRRAQEIEQRGP